MSKERAALSIRRVATAGAVQLLGKRAVSLRKRASLCYVDQTPSTALSLAQGEFGLRGVCLAVMPLPSVRV